MWLLLPLRTRTRQVVDGGLLAGVAPHAMRGICVGVWVVEGGREPTIVYLRTA
jgi:hypothetical protein